MGIPGIIGTTLVSFAAMEGVAWATHKYVMHGFLWTWHKDHHHRSHGHSLERNDLFFAIFALPSILLFVLGSIQGPSAPWTWAGLGILLYGIAYFLVHEVYIHQRLRGLRSTRSPYLQALRRAHKVHHRHTGKQGGACFGMLLVPMAYFWAARQAAAQRGANAPHSPR